MSLFRLCLITFSGFLNSNAVDTKDCKGTVETTRSVEVILLHCTEPKNQAQQQCEKSLIKEAAKTARPLSDCQSVSPSAEYKMLMKAKTARRDPDGTPEKYINVVGAFYRKCMREKSKCEFPWPDPNEENGACISHDEDNQQGLKIGEEPLDPGEAFTINRVMERETGTKSPPKDMGATWVDWLVKHAVEIDGKRRLQVDAETKDKGTKLMIIYAVVVDDWLLKLLEAQKDIYLMNCGNGQDPDQNENAKVVATISSVWGEGDEKCSYSTPIECEAPDSGMSVVMIIIIVCIFLCLCGAFVFYAYFHRSWQSSGGSVRKTHGGTRKPEVELSSTPMMNQYLSAS